MNLETVLNPDSNSLVSEAASCVVFDGVSKSYDGTKVLRDVALEFPAGVTSAIVGASGSGKTTLLRLINALEKIDSGQLYVNGAPLPQDLRTCLLYTSPSPRDLSTSRMPSSA